MKSVIVSVTLLLFFSCQCCLSQAPNLLTDKKSDTVDLIIFSYDRPLQLLACLESISKYVEGLNKTFVLFRSSNQQFKNAYKQVFSQFSNVEPCEQVSIPPQACFKEMLLDIALSKSTSSFVMFGVDDIVVTDNINMCNCMKALEASSAYGFFLRLGKNITECYTLREKVKIPQLKQVCQDISPDIFSWTFNESSGDWNYPHSLDMTLFRKKDIECLLKNLSYTTPNSLDVVLDHSAPRAKQGLCFEHSKIVNIPLNIVQERKLDRNMNLISTQDLLDLFQDGFKIDITELHKIKNLSPHMDYIPNFVK